MQDIEQQASENYINNMKFFEDNHFHLWRKLYELSTDIESGKYEEKYALDYIDNYFDVLQLSSKNYLYANNSTTVSLQLAKQVNYKKNSYVFDGFQMYHGYEQGKKLFDDKAKGLEDIYPLMTYYLDNREPTQEMVEIEKFIFLGVGLGMHLLKIDEKIGAEEYFIIEDDLELFRLSLFTTPYYKLKKSTLFFSIDDDKQTFTSKFQTYLENSFFRNKYLKYSHFPAHPKGKINLIKNALASQAFVSFPYKTNLDKYQRALSYTNSTYKFLNLAEHFTESELSKKPLLIIAAGPSLDKNLEWLKTNHTKFLILALSATLKVLYDNNIQPDIVTHLDGFSTSIGHLKGFNQKEFLQDSIALMGSFTPPEVLSYFKDENIYLIEDHSTSYHKNFGAFSGSCIGSSSIMWATTMGFESIYLLGIDFALTDKGVSHSSAHQLTNTTYDTQTLDTFSSTISLRKNFFNVKGNFRETVQTNPLFYTSIFTLNNTLSTIKQTSQKIYNLNDGAFLSHTVSIHAKEIEIDKFITLKKSESYSSLINLFDTYAKKRLDVEDVASLKERLEFTKEIKAIIFEYKEKPLATQKEHYLYNLISLSLAILKEPTRENMNLVTLYNLYLDYTMPIIFDFFNTKKVTSAKRDIKKIEKIFIKGMVEIVTLYEESLEVFLQEKV